MPLWYCSNFLCLFSFCEPHRVITAILNQIWWFFSSLFSNLLWSSSTGCFILVIVLFISKTSIWFSLYFQLLYLYFILLKFKHVHNSYWNFLVMDALESLLENSNFSTILLMALLIVFSHSSQHVSSSWSDKQLLKILNIFSSHVVTLILFNFCWWDCLDSDLCCYFILIYSSINDCACACVCIKLRIVLKLLWRHESWLLLFLYKSLTC